MNPPLGAKRGHIRLTSHPGSHGPARFPLTWDAATAAERGPVIATINARADRNAIGAHGGSYSIYRALAISSGAKSQSQTTRDRSGPRGVRVCRMTWSGRRLTKRLGQRTKP